MITHSAGGAGSMVLMIEPLVNAIEAPQKETVYDEIIYPSHRMGKHSTSKQPIKAFPENNLLLICGHYKGDRPACPRPFHYP